MKRLNKTGARNGGFSIIETLIVMAASGALFVTVIALISGQQGKTEFSQAVRDSDSRFQDMLNDFSTGYYDRGSDIACSADDFGGAPALTSASSQIGSNLGCSYIGRLMKLSGDGGFTIHTIAGRQYEGAVFSDIVGTLLDAKPRLIHPTTADGGIPNLSTGGEFDGRMNIINVVYLDSANNEQPIGAFGVVSNFGTTSGSILQSDKQSPQVIAIISHPITGTNVELADVFAQAVPAFSASDYVLGRPVAVCFESTRSKQFGIIRIGENQGRLATTSVVGGGTCPADIIP